MKKTLIVFEDGLPELERTAAGIAERLDSERYEVLIRSASTTTIPEILAAEFYLFGIGNPSSSSYAEIARVVGGMNLAGRKAACFGSSGAAVAWLKGIVADSDICIAGTDLIGRQPEVQALSAWLRAIA